VNTFIELLSHTTVWLNFSIRLHFSLNDISTTEFDRKFCDQISRRRYTSSLGVENSRVWRQISGDSGEEAMGNWTGIARCDPEVLMGIGAQFEDQLETEGEFVVQVSMDLLNFCRTSGEGLIDRSYK